MKNQFEVLGIQHCISKKGRPYTVLHCVSDFDDYSVEHGSQGLKCQNIYVASNLPVSCGQTVEFIYGVGFDGKAIVVDVKPIDDKSSKVNK